MMRRFQWVGFALTLILASAAYNPALAEDPNYQKTIDIFKKSPTVQPFFENCYGYAVFPMVGKGGFVIGAAYGVGRVYVNDVITGTAKLVKASIGLQAGGQAFSQIIFFQDRRAYEEFTSGSFELDADLSAVAITAGVQAKAGTQGATAGASSGPATGTQARTTYHKGMAVFVQATGGLMFEAAVGGQQFSFDPFE
jgi:lipid-binding SYLF domain-containing protein